MALKWMSIKLIASRGFSITWMSFAAIQNIVATSIGNDDLVSKIWQVINYFRIFKICFMYENELDKPRQTHTNRRTGCGNGAALTHDN